MTNAAHMILNAIERGRIEAVHSDERLVLLIDLNPVLSIPAEPFPEFAVTTDKVVRIISGATLVGNIQSDSLKDAQEIAEALLDCFGRCRNLEVQTDPQ